MDMSDDMPLVLVTNDDGIYSPGLRALMDSIGKFTHVYVVAPDRERSASSHSLTIHNPLRVQQIDERMFSITGTPTDCVAVGASKILPRKPALVVSGINHGPNLGDDITYSGTVSAAMEGTILNIPSFAISLNSRLGDNLHFDTASRFAADAVRFILEHSLPYDTLLNINVPNKAMDDVAGVRITRQGKRVYEGSIRETSSPWGELYYWIGGGTPYWEHGEDTDINAIHNGYVSVTPLHLDLTNHEAIDMLKRQWKA
jgi:5'-nucleotidase